MVLIYYWEAHVCKLKFVATAPAPAGVDDFDKNLILNDRASWRAYILALIVLLYPGYHVRQSSQNVSYPNFWEMLLIAAYSEIDKIPSVVYMRFVEGGLLRRFILNLKSEDRTFSWLHVWGYMHKGRNNSKREWEVRWKKEWRPVSQKKAKDLTESPTHHFNPV